MAISRSPTRVSATTQFRTKSTRSVARVLVGLDEKIDNVASNLSSHLILKDTMATLPDLTFSVPGAMVDIHGTYDLDEEMIDFEGHLRLDATVSQTFTGFKSFLLK